MRGPRLVASGGLGRPPRRERPSAEPHIQLPRFRALAAAILPFGIAAAAAGHLAYPALAHAASAVETPGGAPGEVPTDAPAETPAEALRRAREAEAALDFPEAVRQYGALLRAAPHAREAAEAETRRAWIVARGGSSADASRLARFVAARAEAREADRAAAEALARDAREATSPLLRTELRLFAAGALLAGAGAPAALALLDEAGSDPTTPAALRPEIRFARARALGMLHGPARALAALTDAERRTSDLGRALRRELVRRRLAWTGLGAGGVALALVVVRGAVGGAEARRRARDDVRRALPRALATAAVVGGGGAATAQLLGAPAHVLFLALGALAAAFSIAAVAGGRLFVSVPRPLRALVAGGLAAAASTGALAALHAPVIERLGP